MLRVALFALPLVACSMSYHSVSASNHQSQIGLVDCTETRRVAIECPDEIDRVAFDIDVRCTTGSLQVRLVAPDGHYCVEETMRGGERKGTLLFAPAPGTWCCELEYAGFSGDTSVTLCATGGASFELEVGVR